MTRSRKDQPGGHQTKAKRGYEYWSRLTKFVRGPSDVPGRFAKRLLHRWMRRQGKMITRDET